MRGIGLTCLALLLVAGCGQQAVQVPVQLHGTYTTSTAGYEECRLQLGPQTIAWRDAEGEVNSHRVTAVTPPEEDVDRTWTLRHKVGGGRDGSFSFTLVGGKIHPVNQPGMVWHRKRRS